MKSCKRTVLALLLIAACIVVLSHYYRATSTPSNRPALKENEDDAAAAAAGGGAVVDRDNFYTLKAPPITSLRGLVLLFHGCTHSKEDWFILPEEVKTVNHLVREGYATAAFSSLDRDTGCWNEEDDGPIIRDVLSADLMVNHPYLAKLPVYALGASSGGTFASALPVYLLETTIQLLGACIIISPGINLPRPVRTTALSLPPSLLELHRRRAYPQRVAMVYMSKDESWATREAAERFAKSISPYQGDSGPVPPSVVYFEAKPKSLKSYENYPLFLTPARKALMIDSFTKHGIIDGDGYFIEDPRLLGRRPGVYSSFLEEIARGGEAGREEDYLHRREQMEEIFNVCFGKHEMTSEFTEEIVRYWEGR